MYPPRKITSAGEEYVHVDDAAEMLRMDEDKLVFDTYEQMIDWIMSGDGYAFSTYSDLKDWVRESGPLEYFDEDELREALGDDDESPSRFELEIGGKTIVATRDPDDPNAMRLKHKDAKQGNNILTLNKDGVIIHKAYRGLAQDDSVADPMMRTIKTNLARGESAILDEAVLRAAKATAMWTADGVTVSARDRGIHTAATLAEAAAALNVPEEVTI